MSEVRARNLAQHLRRRGAVAIAVSAEAYGVRFFQPCAEGDWIVVANGVIIREREELH